MDAMSAPAMPRTGAGSEASKDALLVDCVKALADVRKALDEQKRLHRETLQVLGNGGGVAARAASAPRSVAPRSVPPSSRQTNGSRPGTLSPDRYRNPMGERHARRVKSMVLVSKTTGERRTVPVPTSARSDIGTRLYDDLYHRTHGSATARNGANGTDGTNGTNGSSGANGTNGTNVSTHGKSKSAA